MPQQECVSRHAGHISKRRHCCRKASFPGIPANTRREFPHGISRRNSTTVPRTRRVRREFLWKLRDASIHYLDRDENGGRTACRPFYCEPERLRVFSHTSRDKLARIFQRSCLSHVGDRWLFIGDEVDDEKPHVAVDNFVDLISSHSCRRRPRRILFPLPETNGDELSSTSVKFTHRALACDHGRPLLQRYVTFISSSRKL